MLGEIYIGLAFYFYNYRACHVLGSLFERLALREWRRVGLRHKEA